MIDNLKEWVKKYEVFRKFPLLDLNYKTKIGWGRNLSESGISIEEADLLFENDLKRCQDELSIFPWYLKQPENVQSALINLCFNIGIKGVISFRNMVTAIIDRDYTRSAIELLNSKWADENPDRAKDVALMIRGGM